MAGPVTESESSRPGDDSWLADFVLPDGGIVRFRHVRPEDQPFITDAIRTASRETLLHRFFSPIRSVSPDTMRRMLSIDRSKELCVVGVTEQAAVTRIICGVRYVRTGEPGVAEVAITVHDDFQHFGLGGFLLKLLARLARSEGIRRFEADVLASNEKMLKLFDKAALGRTERRRLGDVYHVVIDLG